MKSIEEQKKELEAQIRQELIARRAPQQVIDKIVKDTISKTTFIGE